MQRLTGLSTSCCEHASSLTRNAASKQSQIGRCPRKHDEPSLQYCMCCLCHATASHSHPHVVMQQHNLFTKQVLPNRRFTPIMHRHKLTRCHTPNVLSPESHHHPYATTTMAHANAAMADHSRCAARLPKLLPQSAVQYSGLLMLTKPQFHPATPHPAWIATPPSLSAAADMTQHRPQRTSHHPRP